MCVQTWWTRDVFRFRGHSSSSWCPTLIMVHFPLLCSLHFLRHQDMHTYLLRCTHVLSQLQLRCSRLFVRVQLSIAYIITLFPSLRNKNSSFAARASGMCSTSSFKDHLCSLYFKLVRPRCIVLFYPSEMAKHCRFRESTPWNDYDSLSMPKLLFFCEKDLKMFSCAYFQL